MARQIDMSREAITSRLKLASQLRRLCLSLGTAKMKTRPVTRTSKPKNREPEQTYPEHKQT